MEKTVASKKWQIPINQRAKSSTRNQLPLTFFGVLIISYNKNNILMRKPILQRELIELS